MNDYEVLGLIGRGQFGAAYKALNTLDNQHYCLKRIHLGNQKDHETALKEAQVLAQLDHPNVLGYKESFLDNEGALCIITTYCEEGDLFTKIRSHAKEKKYFTEQQVMDMFIQISSALLHIHSHKILHRDLKTQNIFIAKGGILKLGDFGISKILEKTDAFATTVTGTPYYMAPEICTNQPYTFKSDIWSLGCVLYELCTLKHAFAGDSLLSLVYQIVRGDFPPIPSDMFSEDLNILVNSLLQRDTEVRPSLQQVFHMPYVRHHLARYQRQETLRWARRSSSLNRKQLNHVATPEVTEGTAQVGLGGPEERLTAKERLAKKREEERVRRQLELQMASNLAIENRAEALVRKQAMLQGSWQRAPDSQGTKRSPPGVANCIRPTLEAVARSSSPVAQVPQLVSPLVSPSASPQKPPEQSLTPWQHVGALQASPEGRNNLRTPPAAPPIFGTGLDPGLIGGGSTLPSTSQLLSVLPPRAQSSHGSSAVLPQQAPSPLNGPKITRSPPITRRSGRHLAEYPIHSEDQSTTTSNCHMAQVRLAPRISSASPARSNSASQQSLPPYMQPQVSQMNPPWPPPSSTSSPSPRKSISDSLEDKDDVLMGTVTGRSALRPSSASGRPFSCPTPPPLTSTEPRSLTPYTSMQGRPGSAPSSSAGAEPVVVGGFRFGYSPPSSSGGAPETPGSIPLGGSRPASANGSLASVSPIGGPIRFGLRSKSRPKGCFDFGNRQASSKKIPVSANGSPGHDVDSINEGYEDDFENYEDDPFEDYDEEGGGSGPEGNVDELQREVQQRQAILEQCKKLKRTGSGAEEVEELEDSAHWGDTNVVEIRDTKIRELYERCNSALGPKFCEVYFYLKDVRTSPRPPSEGEVSRKLLRLVNQDRAKLAGCFMCDQLIFQEMMKQKGGPK